MWPEDISNCSPGFTSPSFIHDHCDLAVLHQLYATGMREPYELTAASWPILCTCWSRFAFQDAQGRTSYQLKFVMSQGSHYEIMILTSMNACWIYEECWPWYMQQKCQCKSKCFFSLLQLFSSHMHYLRHWPQQKRSYLSSKSNLISQPQAPWKSFGGSILWWPCMILHASPWNMLHSHLQAWRL